MNTPASDVFISAPVLTRAIDGASRVEANVDGTPTWFESRDAELTASPEAFASAFLGPALAAGRRLHIAAPLDATWRSNVASILPVWLRWWGYHADADTITCDGARTKSQPRSESWTASCFTGGADSFYTLLRSPRASQIDRLLFVHGYDIPLADETRMAAWENDLRRVASAVGRPAIVVRTNLRLHPLFRQSNWERTHGGALAAAAHVLSGNVARLLIPSTYTYGHEQPWGSHHLTDGFWSSTELEVVHDDASINRRDKLRALADEPLAWDALRVCWEGRTPTGNCSMCEKCVRTMTVLHLCGRLEKFKTFDQTMPLARRIAGLKWLPPHLLYVYDALLKDGLSGAEAQAVRRLLADSRPPGLLRRVARRAKQSARRFIGVGR